MSYKNKELSIAFRYKTSADTDANLPQNVKKLQNILNFII